MKPRSKQPATETQETLCRSAGSLIQRLPTQPEATPGELPDRVARALPKTRLDLRLRRRLLVFALSGAAVLAAGVALQRSRPLGYDVAGVAAPSSGRVETGAGQTARVRFTDGTAIVLLERTSGAVVERTSDGATFALERGRANFDVVHRARARWRVVAGPFEILVTGTRFDLTWPDGAGVLTLDLRAGSVIVRGGAAKSGISVRAGERISLRTDGPPPTTVPDRDSTSPPPAAGQAEAETAAPMRSRSRRPSADDPPATAPDGLRPPPAILPTAATERPDLAAGGSACASDPPQLRFDRSTEGAHASTVSALALSHAAVGRVRSWCGDGALSLDADFDLSGSPNRLQRRPRETGGVWVNLGRAFDFTGHTLTAHVYVEAPPNVRFAAELFVVEGTDLGGKWAGAGKISNLSPGHWITISHTFAKETPLWDGSTTDVTNANFVAVNIFSEGGVQVWRGKVLIDEIGWR